MDRCGGHAALSRAARGYLHASRAAGRVGAALHGLASGFFSTAMTVEEQSAFSIALYDALDGRREPRQVYAWEVDWFDRRLPAPPARILVGAAGDGPEVRHLVACGHQADAFDPAEAAAAACRAIPGVGEVLDARYEDLTRALLDAAPTAASPLRGRRYDAVLLGWGSLSHVLDPRERARLLAACAQLAPQGPILVSYLSSAAVGSGSRAARLGASLGRRLGTPLARQRGAAPASGETDFASWFGFVHLFAAGELDALARAAGRRFEPEPSLYYPHATLLP